MAKEWFSRKSLVLNSEKVDIKVKTPADAKLNNQRILTALDIYVPPAPIIDVHQTFYSALPAQTKLLNATTPVLLTFNTITPTALSGIQQNAPGEYSIRRIGNYKFKIQFTGPEDCRYYVQMRVNNVPYDGESRETTAPIFVGIENSCSWIFFYSLSSIVDPPLISFYALGQTLEGTPANVTVNHEIAMSVDGTHI